MTFYSQDFDITKTLCFESQDRQKLQKIIVIEGTFHKT